MRSKNRPLIQYTVHAVVDSLEERLAMQEAFHAELIANVLTLPHSGEGSGSYVDKHGRLHVFLFAEQLDVANELLARVNVGKKQLAKLFT